MKNRLRYLLVSILLLGCGVGSAQVEDTVNIKEFVLEDEKTTTERIFKINVIDSAVLSQNIASDLATVLNENSDVFIKSYGQGALATASFRGTQSSHTQVFWNDMPVNFATLGLTDFALIPVIFADEVQVEHGGASMTNGSGGLGGGINLINTVKWEKRLSVMVQQKLASFDDYRSAAAVKWGNHKWQSVTKLYYNTAQNDFPYYNIAKEKHPVEHQENAEFVQYGAMQELYTRLNSKNSLSVKAWYNKTDRNIPKLITIQNKQEENEKDDLFRSMLEWKNVGQRLNWKLQSAYFFDQINYNNKVASIASDSRVDSWKNQWKGTYQLFDRLKFRGNAFFNYEKAQSDGYDGEIKRVYAGGYLNAVYQPFERVTLSGLLREEVVDDQLSPLMYNIGGAYEAVEEKGFLLKAAASRNYRVPSLNDLYWFPGGNPDLQPEIAQSFEGGFESSISLTEQLTLRANATGYYALIDQMIQWLPGDKGYWTAQNVRKVETKGAEASMEISWNWNKFKLKAAPAYNYTQSVNKQQVSEQDQGVGKQLIYVPLHSGRMRFQVSKENYFLAYNHVFTGRRYITTDNFYYMPPYALGDIKLGTRFQLFEKNELSVQVEVNNLWDEQYQAIAWRPMPGRNYAVTVRYRYLR